MIVVRPDHYVGILPLTVREELADFFAQSMVEARTVQAAR